MAQTDSSTRPGRRPWLQPVFCVLAASALTGCTALGYRLGSTLPADIRTVRVLPFINQTREPQLDVVTTRATIEAIQRDGVLRLVSDNTSDTTLQVTLTGIEMEPIRYDTQERKTTEEYRMRLTAQVVFARHPGGARLIDGAKVEGRTMVEFVGDMASSKRQAMPAAADDLAREIVRTIQEYW